MDRRVFFALLAYTALLGFLYALYLVLRPFLPALGWAAVIAIATYPVYDGLRRRLPLGETWVSALTTLMVFLVLVVPGVFIGLTLAQEIGHAQEYIGRWSAEERKLAIDEVLHHPWVAPLVARANELVTLYDINIKEAAVQSGQRLLRLLFDSLTGAAKQVALFVLQLLLVLIALFFLYRDGAKLTQGFWSALPIGEERKRVIHDTVENVVSAVVIGILVTASLQGLLAGLAYWLVGLGSPVLLGTLTAIAALVPVVGTMLVWVPAVAYLLLAGQVVDGLILAGWCALVVGSADNFLRPLLISGRTGLPFSLMTLGALGGLAAFGFFGLVVGPLVLAVFVIVFEMVRKDVIAFDAGLRAPEAEPPGRRPPPARAASPNDGKEGP